MNQPLVTIVLPIYNVEKYLNKCVESVVNQTYKNLEILMVNDGSHDGCAQICDDWAKRDCRVRAIHKQNQGLGMARNTGIEHALGEFICFFDSDDYIREDTVEKTVKKIVEQNADMAIFGYSSVRDDGTTLSTFIPAVGEQTYRGDSVRETFLPDFIAPDYRQKRPRALYMSAWVAMYSMAVIRRSGWRFVSEREIIAEDVYSLVDFVQHVDVVTVVPEAFYYYRINEQSLSRSYRPDRYQKIRYFYQETIKLCGLIGYNKDVLHRVSKPYLSFTLAALKQEASADCPMYQRFGKVKSIVNDEILQQVLWQNRNDVVSWPRWLIFFFMRHKWHMLTYLLLIAKG